MGIGLRSGWVAFSNCFIIRRGEEDGQDMGQLNHQLLLLTDQEQELQLNKLTKVKTMDFSYTVLYNQLLSQPSAGNLLPRGLNPLDSAMAFKIVISIPNFICHKLLVSLSDLLQLNQQL